MSDTEKLLSDEPYEDESLTDSGEDESVDENVDEADEDQDDSEDESEESDDDSGASSEESSSQEKDSKSVPLAVLLEERRARQALQRQVNELMARIPQPDPVDPTADLPDPINDPQGFAKAVLSKSEEATQKMRYSISEAMVKEEGATDEDIEAALQAVETLPVDQRPSFRSKAHPFKALLQWHKDFQLTGGKPDAVDIDSIRRQIKEEIMKELRGSEAPVSEKKVLRSPPSAAGDIGGRRLKPENEAVELDTKSLFGVIR